MSLAAPVRHFPAPWLWPWPLQPLAALGAVLLAELDFPVAEMAGDVQSDSAN